MCITLEHVSRTFEGRKVLQDVSLSLPRQGRICLFGPSGCGKTTLLRLMCGLDRPDGGRVTIPAGTRFSCHFQEDRLLPWETAAQNAAIASTREIAAELLTELGLGAELDKYPKELSGGMNRRVSIARALAAKADVYIMDEPFRGLDPETRSAVFGVIRRRTEDALLIMVTHDPTDAECADMRIDL